MERKKILLAVFMFLCLYFFYNYIFYILIYIYFNLSIFLFCFYRILLALFMFFITIIIFIFFNAFSIYLIIFFIETSQFPSTFLGFSLYVSNTTRIKDRVLYYHDDQYTTLSIPPELTFTKPVQARYVTYYNSRKGGLSTKPGYSATASLGLCEVQVFGRYFYFCDRYINNVKNKRRGYVYLNKQKKKVYIYIYIC